MWFFKVIQNGLVFTSLAAGIVVGGHLVYCNSTKCRNWLLVFTTVVTGFLHMLTCLFLLGLSELSGYNNLSNGGKQDCVDYTSSATLANALVFTIVALNIIKQNTDSKLKAYSAITLQIFSTSTGLVLLNGKAANSTDDMQQNVFLSLGRKGTPHVDVFWSMCQILVSEASYRLLCEYCLFYIPIAMTVFVAWYKNYRRTGDPALVRLKIFDSGCKGNGFTSSTCICTRLNTSFAAILFYSFLVLFLVRPAMILYGHVTSGFFRDVLPSLLQSVIYCFICSEYITYCYKLNLLRPRLTTLKNSSVLRV